MLHGHVENAKGLTRKEVLEAYDGCARLRPVWDDIAGKYDTVFTPSVVDEAPVGIRSTGDAVSFPFSLSNIISSFSPSPNLRIFHMNRIQFSC